MRLTVIGKSPAFTDAGGACSGYLVEDGGTRLLVDCGNGVFGKLRAATDPFALDGVVISHVHADHVLDLVPFAYALLFARGGRPFPPLPLHVPPGGRTACTGSAASGATTASSRPPSRSASTTPARRCAWAASTCASRPCPTTSPPGR